jgi:hypothetical protein
MAALIRTGHVGVLQWLGIVAERGEGLRSSPVGSLTLRFAGAVGEAHGGLTRPACSRVAALHPRGTEIRNTRQLSILCAGELAATAAAIGLESLDPALLGANAVVAGLPDFTHLPPGARLQGEDGATVVVEMENLPCQLPAREIEREAPGLGARFRAAAAGRRGVTAWVEREGTWRVGGLLHLFVPAQRPWSP